MIRRIYRLVRITKKVRIFFLLLLFQASISFAQSNAPIFNLYDNRVGLTANSINCISEDSLGFLWIGTQNGLNKFDGREFINFRSIPGDNNSLPQPDILCITADKTGLWIGTNGGGLVRYSYQERQFKTTGFGIDSLKKYTADNTVRAVITDSRHYLWVGTLNGLYSKNKLDRSFTHYELTPGNLAGNNVTSIIEDHSGRIWVGSASGLYRYSGGHFIRFELSGHPEKKLYITSIVESSTKTGIWVGTKTGLYFFDFKKSTLSPVKSAQELKNSYISNMYLSKTPNFWIGTINQGLYQFDAESHTVESIKLSDINSVTTDSYIRTIFESSNGILWLGLYANGLLKYDPQKKLFQTIALNESGETDVRNACWSVFEDNNERLFIGTNSIGLIIYDRSRKKYINVNPQLQSVLKKSAIRAITGDGSSVIWLGTDLFGVFRYDTKTEEFQNFQTGKKEDNAIGGNTVRSLFLDNDYLYVGHLNEGLSVIRLSDSHIRRIKTFEGLSKEFTDIWDYYKQNDSLIWMATGLGLVRFNVSRFSYDVFANTGDDHFFSNTAIWFDGDSTLWLGTRYYGLNKFNFISGERKSFTIFNSPIADNTIYTITPDSANHLWLTTDKGISEFDPVTEKSWNYTLEDGLINLEFSSGAAFRTKKGELFFGGTNGVNWLDPHGINHQQSNSKILLRSIKVMGKEIAADRHKVPVEFLKSVELLPNEEFVTFDFVVLDFSSNIPLKYQYFLKGFTDNWINIENNRSISFSNLNPGSYQLQIREEGRSESGIMLDIIVRPYLWETLWFKILFIVLLGLAVYGFMTFRIHRINQINNLRWQIAADLHDQLGGSLSGVALKTEIIASQSQTSESVRRSLLGLVKNQRELVENIDDIVWSVNPDNDKIGILVQKIQDLTDSAFSGLPMICEVYHRVDNPMKKLILPYRKNIYLIIKESLNNAVKHSEASLVTVLILYHQPDFEVKITDNGKGFDPENAASGFGMSTLKKRAEEIGGKLSISSEPGEGTTVLLKVTIA